MATQTSSRHASPFTALRRVPLCELPLHNFVERPPSPTKSYSSPTKSQKTMLSPPKQARSSSSSTVTSSVPVNTASRRQLFRDVLRTNEEVADIPLEQSPPIKGKGSSNIKKSTVFASPKAIKARNSPKSPILKASSPPLAASSKSSATSSSAVPQSLGRKKDRIRRELLDEDEGGSAFIRAGSPSPSKMKAEREMALRGSAPTISTSISTSKNDGTWTIWQDTDEEIEAALHGTTLETTQSQQPDESDDAQDKENVKPADANIGSITSSRKKGTGGRLSLLATGDEAEGDQSIDALGKRRKMMMPASLVS